MRLRFGQIHAQPATASLYNVKRTSPRPRLPSSFMTTFSSIPPIPSTQYVHVTAREWSLSPHAQSGLLRFRLGVRFQDSEEKQQTTEQIIVSLEPNQAESRSTTHALPSQSSHGPAPTASRTLPCPIDPIRSARHRTHKCIDSDLRPALARLDYDDDTEKQPCDSVQVSRHARAPPIAEPALPRPEPTRITPSRSNNVAINYLHLIFDTDEGAQQSVLPEAESVGSKSLALEALQGLSPSGTLAEWIQEPVFSPIALPPTPPSPSSTVMAGGRASPLTIRIAPADSTYNRHVKYDEDDDNDHECFSRLSHFGPSPGSKAQLPLSPPLSPRLPQNAPATLPEDAILPLKRVLPVVQPRNRIVPRVNSSSAGGGVILTRGRSTRTGSNGTSSRRAADQHDVASASSSGKRRIKVRRTVIGAHVVVSQSPSGSRSRASGRRARRSAGARADDSDDFQSLLDDSASSCAECADVDEAEQEVDVSSDTRFVDLPALRAAHAKLMNERREFMDSSPGVTHLALVSEYPDYKLNVNRRRSKVALNSAKWHLFALGRANAERLGRNRGGYWTQDHDDVAVRAYLE